MLGSSFGNKIFGINEHDHMRVVGSDAVQVFIYQQSMQFGGIVHFVIIFVKMILFAN